ncbi:MAG: ATP-binding protein [Lentimicrobiaceae bacterium]|jgi:predicted AAA+ superfamily ATPase|nr:ATP-binding protein [Lentimicrobiaceae bacterium]
MVSQAIIELTVESQKNNIAEHDFGVRRDLLAELRATESYAVVLSGIRRCGKSTLMQQVLKQSEQPTFYINFDDPRLFRFEMQDFQLLDNIISAQKATVLFFDEIQVVEGWELYVRQKLDEGFLVFVTGSNASLLSRELGTKLTGRHISKELFPFSYTEFLSCKNLGAGEESFKHYFETGGFPEYIKTLHADMPAMLLQDILYRDIAVRHGVRDIRALKQLTVFALSNVGNLITANKIYQSLGIKTVTTVLEYFSFLEDAYLLAFMPKFSYSLKVQSVNPRKMYVVDSAIIQAVSVSFSKDLGHILENIIYWELRRNFKELYYFKENNRECDFVVMQSGKLQQLIQVCYELTPENRTRETDGLHEAMDFFKTDQGIIITFNQKDAYMRNGRQIDIIPAWQFLQNTKSCFSC